MGMYLFSGYLVIGFITGILYVKRSDRVLKKKPETQEDYDLLSDYRFLEDMVGRKFIDIFTLVFVWLFWLPGLVFMIGDSVVSAFKKRGDK